MNNRALALLSAGLDSSIATLMAKKDYEIVFTITFDYGQRAARREVEQAQKISTYLGLSHRVIELPWFTELSSGLIQTDHLLPKPTPHQLSESVFAQQSAKAVWVPNRNGIFLEIAAAFAEANCAQNIIVGFNAEEAQTFPDNSVAYLEAITQALSFSTQNRARVVSPTAHLDKDGIVSIAKQLQFPWELLWSCYHGLTKMCGHCESCMRLKRALHLNHLKLDEALFEYTAF